MCAEFTLNLSASVCSPAVDGGELPLVSEAEPGLWQRPSEGSSMCLLGPWTPPTAPCGDARLDLHHLRLGLDDGEEPRAGCCRQRQRGCDWWRWGPMRQEKKQVKDDSSMMSFVNICLNSPQKKSWWRPSGSVWFLLPCVRSSSSWPHQSTRWPSSASLSGPISCQHSLLMETSQCTAKVGYTLLSIKMQLSEWMQI